VQVQELEMPPDLLSRDKRAIDPPSHLCSLGTREYADIASRSSASFFDNCGGVRSGRHYTETNEDT